MNLAVLLPFRNAASCLSEAVKSVQRQTFKEWTLWLLDDGSTDRGPELADQMAHQDVRIQVLHLKPNGIVSALNHGIERCGKVILARMDADDICHPERFEKQLRLLQTYPEVDLVSCRVAFGGDREEQAGYARHVDWQNTLVTHKEMFLNRFVDATVAHPSVMFRRSAVERWGGYREGDFPEDFEMWLRWMDAGGVFAKVA